MHVDHCPRHGDVDAILRSGHYMDRKGRFWMRNAIEWWTDTSRPWRSIPPSQMRTLILREQHREVCPGLRACEGHPVPHVVTYRGAGYFSAFGPYDGGFRRRPSLTEALDAARHMTGETP